MNAAGQGAFSTGAAVAGASVPATDGTMGAGTNTPSVRYQAVCSSCGNLTSLPFEPTPGRPVYCRDCMKKIDSGEMKPIRSTWTATPKPVPSAVVKPKQEFFAPEKTVEAPKKQPSTVPATAPAPVPASAPASRQETFHAPKESSAVNSAPLTSSAPTGMSLSELTRPKEKAATTKHGPHAAVNIDDLRAAIRASLNADLVTGDADPVVIPAPDAILPDIAPAPLPPVDDDDEYESDRAGRHH